MNIQFFKKTDDDNLFIKTLFFQYKMQELQNINIPPNQLNLLLEMQFDAQQTSYKNQFPNAIDYILEIDNIPIGWLQVNNAKTIHIINIIIHEKYRNKNFGKQVILEIIKWAKRENKKVTLKVDRNNPAQRLYSRLGFITTNSDEIHITMST